MDNNNIFEDVKKDDSLPLADLLKNAANEEKTTDTKASVVPNGNAENKPMTALQKMKMEKEKAGEGMVISNEELEKGSEKIPSSDMINTAERAEDWQKALDEQDEIAKKRAAVTLLHQPKDPAEYTQMMDEIQLLVGFREDGTAYLKPLFDENGNEVSPRFIRLKKDGDPDFDEATILKENPGFVPPTKQVEETEEKNEVTPDGEAKEEEVPSEEDLHRAKVVQVLIDKTGYGADFAFTEEEKSKIEEADVIRLNEVKTIDIAAIKSKRSDKSFQNVIADYSARGSKSTICFPASGFRAQMKGLSYGEYADVSLSMDNVTFDQYYKRLSIIYNKMTNISTGPFKDFEDFLKHFAYTDIYLAIYAMYVATEQEHQEQLLKCGNSQCNHTFNWKFNTRSVLRLDGCSQNFLDRMEEIATADPDQYDAIRDRAAVNVSKTIELPDSKFVVEMGVASAYDFLYNFIPVLNEETFRETFGDDPNEIYLNNILLLTTVRAVYVPDGEGGYIECTGYKDILESIYKVSPREIQILTAYTIKIQNNYEVSFGFKDVTCPHCGNVTDLVSITVDDLVFRTYQQLMNTSVDLESIQDL